MDRSPGFGSITCNCVVLVTLGFPAAPQLNCLTSLHTITRRTVLQKVPHRTNIVLCVLVNIRFQVLFHSPPGVLFTFPSQYCSTIGHQVVFRLGGWSPRLPIGFLVSDGTLDTAKLSLRFTYKTLTSFGWLSHAIRLQIDILHRGPKPRKYFYSRFSLFRFRSPLLAKSRLISLPPGT